MDTDNSVERPGVWQELIGRGQWKDIWNGFKKEKGTTHIFKKLNEPQVTSAHTKSEIYAPYNQTDEH